MTRRLPHPRGLHLRPGQKNWDKGIIYEGFIESGREKSKCFRIQKQNVLKIQFPKQNVLNI